MKRFLAILLALVLMLSLVPAALAEEPATTTTTTTTTSADSNVNTTGTTDQNTTTTTQPGDTSTIPPVTDPVSPTAQPGTFAYTLSQLIERIRVLLTPDLAAKAELLAQQAQQRIAELEQLQPTQVSVAQEVTQAYIDRLNAAVNYMMRAQAKGKDITKAQAKLFEAAEGGKVIAEGMEVKLGDEDVDELSEAADKAALNAACIANVPPEVVKTLREQGLGYGEIALINLLAVKSGKTPDEVAKIFVEKGFGATAAELGLTVSELKKNAHGFAEAVQAMDPAKVHELRQKGFSYGKIATIQMMSEISGKPVQDVNALVSSEGFGKAVKDLGISMKELHARAKQARKQAKTGTQPTPTTDPNAPVADGQTTQTPTTAVQPATTQPAGHGQGKGKSGK